MGKYNREFVSLVCALLCLLCLLGAQARADEAQGEDNGWYFDAGASVYVVDLPDWAPLWHFNNVNGSEGKRQALVDEPLVAPLLDATVGTQLAGQWFVEARGEYANSEPSDRNSYTSGSEYMYVGYFSLSGEHGANASDKTTYVHSDLTFQEYGLALLAGKTLAWDQVQARLFTGYWFRAMNLDYAYDLYTSSSSDRRYQWENLETAYNGLLVGLGLDWRWERMEPGGGDHPRPGLGPHRLSWLPG